MKGKLVFEKRPGKYDAMFVERGGALEEIPCPKQRPIPHDMFHYAVETVLGKQGFAHRVAAGEGAGFRMTPEATSEAVERLVETMQADSWSGRPPAHEVVALFEATCAARGDAPFTVEPGDIVDIRDEIDRLAALWEALPDRGRLELEVD
ncbi:MAG: hypothetical protein NW200_03680 [Hyphomonadaceae bacterium]|nr:hypothetical protein [Hyphomonadaceae bacterium]